MNEELVWVRETPFKIKLYVLLGIYASQLMGIFFFLLCADSFVHMLSASGEIDVTFFTSSIHTYSCKLFYNVRFLVTLSLSLLHAFCRTGIRHQRTYNYPTALIICYLFILFISIALKSIPFIIVTLLFMIIWFICLWGLSLFRTFCDEYIETHRIKDHDPYGLIREKIKVPLSPFEKENTEVTSAPSYFESYGTGLIEPIKVDLEELTTPKSKSKDDEPSSKDYF